MKSGNSASNIKLIFRRHLFNFFFLLVVIKLNQLKHEVLHDTYESWGTTSLIHVKIYCSYNDKNTESYSSHHAKKNLKKLTYLPFSSASDETVTPLQKRSSSIYLVLCCPFKWFHKFVVFDPELAYVLLHNMQVTHKPLFSLVNTCHTSLIVK